MLLHLDRILHVCLKILKLIHNNNEDGFISSKMQGVNISYYCNQNVSGLKQQKSTKKLMLKFVNIY